MGRVVGESCWTKIPYASLFATLILLAGACLAAVTLYMATDDVELFLRTTFNVTEEVLWMQTVSVIFVVVASCLALFSFILLGFGVVATGETRQNVYSGEDSIFGGRCVAILLMTLTYLVNLCWMAVTSVMVIPIVIMIMVNSICNIEFDPTNDYQPGRTNRANYCFNLTRFGFYFPGYNEREPDNWERGPALCYKNDQTNMCSVVKRALPLFSAGFGGCFAIMIALVSFLMIITANYQRIKTSKELTDYRDALVNDTTEMDNIISNRRQYQSSYAPSE